MNPNQVEMSNIKHQFLNSHYYNRVKVDFGPILDHYDIIREIGRGGFGCVYEARGNFQMNTGNLYCTRAKPDLTQQPKASSLVDTENYYVIKMINGLIDPILIEYEILISEFLSYYAEFTTFINCIYYNNRFFLVFKLVRFQTFEEILDKSDLGDV